MPKYLFLTKAAIVFKLVGIEKNLCLCHFLTYFLTPLDLYVDFLLKKKICHININFKS